MNTKEIRQLLTWFLEWLGKEAKEDCYCAENRDSGVMTPCNECLRARIVKALADIEADRKIMEALDQ